MKKCQNFEFSKFQVFLFEISQNYYFTCFERHKMLQIEVGIMKNNKKNENLKNFTCKNSNGKNNAF